MGETGASADAVQLNVQPQEGENKPNKPTRRNLRKRSGHGDEELDDKSIHPAAGGEIHRDKRTDNKPRPSTFTFSTKTHKGDGPRVGVQFESSNAVQMRDDGGATRALEIEEGKKAATHGDGSRNGDGNGDADGQQALYRGMAGYKDYRQGFRRETATHGPLRAPTNLRMSIRVDYQPDVCKDYKETGYCGFGDACKFLHDRGDYKAGWELDRDWEEQQKAQRERLAAAEAGMLGDEDEAGRPGGDSNDNDNDDSDDDLPFACFICRRPWSECEDPVVTRCKHYFCEQCALKHNAKSKKCFVCNQPTGGIFNVAHDILKREKRRK